MTTINNASLAFVCGGSSDKKASYVPIEKVKLLDATPRQIAMAIVEYDLRLPTEEQLHKGR